ncbi:MAG: manganese efflux pump MntP family protein [Brevundimonas sp.]|uniref:manganese efflux pump MntP n=1 Tax=Brevundimonas sp. TaxID=1871086 RepID=UPI00391D866E
MTPGAIAILSLSMSTDAFAAAVGRGAAHRPSLAPALRDGLTFWIIEAMTPVIGWSLGLIAAEVVQQYDHWIAFVLLAGVGAHMAWHGLANRHAVQPAAPVRRGLIPLIAVALGTSIDAAAVGVGLAFIGVNIWVIALCIGLTTFTLTTLGMLIGARVGARFGKYAEILGGLALIAIGTLILAEHMGWMGG